LRKGGRGPIDESVVLYLVALAVLGGGGLLVGVVFRWWGLLVSVGFVVFLAFAWEFDSTGVTYALIAGVLASVAVLAGVRLRGKLQNRVS
jgi:hypothetical protein